MVKKPFDEVLLFYHAIDFVSSTNKPTYKLKKLCYMPVHSAANFVFTFSSKNVIDDIISFSETYIKCAF